MPWVGYSRLIIYPFLCLCSLGVLSGQHNLCNLNHLTKQCMPQSHDLCLSPAHHPMQQLLIIWVTVTLPHSLYPFYLGKEIICALIKYVSRLITESHFWDLFSETNLGFVYWISQIPSSEQMVYSKGVTKESLTWRDIDKGVGKVVTHKKWKSTWLIRIECCYHPWLESTKEGLFVGTWSWKYKEGHPAEAVAFGIGTQLLLSSYRKGDREQNALTFLRSYLLTSCWCLPLDNQKSEERGSASW